MKVADCVFMLEVRRDRGSLYPTVIRDGCDCVLVDAGLPGMAGAVVQAMADEGMDAAKVTGIVLTHQDMDHIGGVKEMLRAAPAAMTYAHRLEAPYVDGTKTPQKLAARLARAATPQEKAEHEQSAARAAAMAFAIDRELDDGDALPFAGGTRVIHTPGHTDGHICLFAEKTGVLVAGDLLHIDAGELAGPNPVHTPDMKLAFDQLEKLMGIGVKAVISYHGGLFTGDVDAGLMAIINKGF